MNYSVLNLFLILSCRQNYILHLVIRPKYCVRLSFPDSFTDPFVRCDLVTAKKLSEKHKLGRSSAVSSFFFLFLRSLHSPVYFLHQL
jgi:hypothetical protein